MFKHIHLDISIRYQFRRFRYIIRLLHKRYKSSPSTPKDSLPKKTLRRFRQKSFPVCMCALIRVLKSLTEYPQGRKVDLNGLFPDIVTLNRGIIMTKEKGGVSGEGGRRSWISLRSRSKQLQGLNKTLFPETRTPKSLRPYMTMKPNIKCILVTSMDVRSI